MSDTGHRSQTCVRPAESAGRSPEQDSDTAVPLSPTAHSNCAENKRQCRDRQASASARGHNPIFPHPVPKTNEGCSEPPEDATLVPEITASNPTNQLRLPHSQDPRIYKRYPLGTLAAELLTASHDRKCSIATNRSPSSSFSPPSPSSPPSSTKRSKRRPI
eukprot:1770648-Rhodomonas_salina.1